MLFERESGKTGGRVTGFFDRMKKALGATKANLVSRIETALAGRAAVDESLLENLEEILLGADIGVTATDRIMKSLREMQRQNRFGSAGEIRDAIREEMLQIFQGKHGTAPAAPVSGPEIWLVVGVNGTGKTTSVGKLAAKMAGAGRRVLICAADTFRPAAIEQLAIWAERSGCELIRSRTGADPAAVLHDAIAAAEARGNDLLIVDTAGRLHTRGNLMQELEKMKRVAARKMAGAPHQVFLVLDATTGQNGLSQAREFYKTAGVTGLIVTKLDGTAKGGVLFGIVQELGLPVSYIGVGEGLDDLMDFAPRTFIDSLFFDKAPGATEADAAASHPG